MVSTVAMMTVEDTTVVAYSCHTSHESLDLSQMSSEGTEAVCEGFSLSSAEKSRDDVHKLPFPSSCLFFSTNL